MKPKTFTPAARNPFAARAIKAYLKRASALGEVVQQPASHPDLYTCDADRKYVVLDNCHGILAVYRVRNDGRLKRLVRWPAALSAATGEAAA